MPQIFREKSLERAASPDRLDDYIKVSNPSAWIILAVIVLLIGGAGIWACFGHLSDTQAGVLVVDGSTSVCYVAQEGAGNLSDGDEVEVAGISGSVASVSSEPVPYTALPAEAQRLAGGDAQAWFRSASVAIDLADGTYAATVVTETYNPIALLFGQR